MIRVCILDDHPILADGIRRLVETEGDIKVIADYRSVDECEALLPELQADVAIIDILLKEDSGLRAMKSLREARPELPVIALSMYSTEPYFSEALKLGARAYVTKGRAHDEIVPAIRAVLRGQRYFCEDIKDLVEKAQEPSSDEDTKLGGDLTARETEVFRHLALGLAPKQIANLLGINAKTVHVHKANIAKKIGVHYQADIVKAALARGIIAAEDLTL
ncbi:MAG: response regulator transcription factor [Halieaceae bacterium]|jgi:two-component system NarL family response regulator|nr:response regulator transcription factor [Halieaceae bacterium]